MNPGITVTAILVVVSFAIDRVVSGLLFLLSFFSTWREFFPEPQPLVDPVQRYQAEKKQKLVYFVLAALGAALLVVTFPDLLLLQKLGFKPGPNHVFWDRAFTVIALIGGADRIAELAKSPGSVAASRPQSTPVVVTGKLTLVDNSAKTDGLVR